MERPIPCASLHRLVSVDSPWLRSCVAFRVASAQVARTPNLKPLPASNFSLVTDTTAGTHTLRFSTTSWNNGAGTAATRGRAQLGHGQRQTAGLPAHLQLSDGTSTSLLRRMVRLTTPVTTTFHFDDYALYTLQPVNVPGGSLRTGSKTTFCVMDTTKIDGSLAGAPAVAVYATCGKPDPGHVGRMGRHLWRPPRGPGHRFHRQPRWHLPAEDRDRPEEGHDREQRERQPLLCADRHHEAEHGHGPGQQRQLFHGGVDQRPAARRWAPPSR